MNTRDPRNSRDNTRGSDYRGTEYRDTRYSTTPELRPDRSWLRWVIPAAIAALVLPLLFHRSHREPEQTTSAFQQSDNTMTNHLASLPTSTSLYFENGGADLTDADRQKLAQVASSAKQNGTGISVTGPKERADAVRQALISEGVPESSIEVQEGASDQGTEPVRLTLAQK